MTDETDDPMTWDALYTLLVITTLQPGRLQYADTNEDMTPDRLIEEHKTDFPEARERYYHEILPAIRSGKITMKGRTLS